MFKAKSVSGIYSFRNRYKKLLHEVQVKLPFTLKVAFINTVMV